MAPASQTVEVAVLCADRPHHHATDRLRQHRRRRHHHQRRSCRSDPVGHTDVDRDLSPRFRSRASPPRSVRWSRSLPGVSADSNGMFHGMGDPTPPTPSPSMASPSPTRTSKTFSNQIPMDSVQSLMVIPGAPPADSNGENKTSTGYRRHHPLRPGREQAHRRGHRLLRLLRLLQLGFNLATGLRQAGQLHLRHTS